MGRDWRGKKWREGKTGERKQKKVVLNRRKAMDEWGRDGRESGKLGRKEGRHERRQEQNTNEGKA